MSDKKSNLKALMANGRSRLVIMLTAAVLLGIALIAVSSLRGIKKNAADQGDVQTAQVPTTETIPGTSTSDAYNKLQEAENKTKAVAAQKSGETFIPILTAPSSQTETPLSLPQAPVVERKVEAPVVQAQVQPVVQHVALPVRVAIQVDPKEASELQARMSVFVETTAPVPGRSEVEFTSKANDPKLANSYSVGAGAYPGSQAQPRPAPAQAVAKASFVKAGTIVPAVLLTAINTDEPGPILAEIVSGPLKGSRLIGAITVPSNGQAQKVVLGFSTLVMPKVDHSFSVSTFAVDPATDRTAFASDVNNHYLSKYGLLFAAAFVTGYGQAMQTSSSTTVTPAVGGATTIYAPSTAQQATWAGLGAIGKQASSELAQNANMRPTITVNAGLSVGILFMSDF